LTYYFGIRGKKQDIFNEKTKELNVVLSNMLNTRYYLHKLNESLKLLIDKSDDLILPKQYIPYIALTTGVLNDDCFKQLEDSIDELKKYDPVSYYNLKGVGTSFDYIRKNYITPFLKYSKNSNEQLSNFSSTFLDELLNKMDEHLRNTSKLISKKVYNDTDNIIVNNYFINTKQIIEEYNKKFYEIILNTKSKEDVKPSYEEFLLQYTSIEAKEQFRKEFELIVKKGMEAMTKVLSENPNLTMEELEMKLEEYKDQS